MKAEQEEKWLGSYKLKKKSQHGDRMELCIVERKSGNLEKHPGTVSIMVFFAVVLKNCTVVLPVCQTWYKIMW